MVESAAEPPIAETITRGDVESKMSPSILLIMIIVAIIFFMSGVLHLLVRFLVKPNNRDPDEAEEVSALQGQLQQLFYLHDAGVEQSLIDRLPQFQYSSVMGVKDPFDCAVCLCEFEGEDRLRLLPKCSHAFHTDCIDTWLLSHSTCPLCRFNLLQGISPAQSSRFPLVCLLHEPDPNFHRTNSDIPRISTDSIVTVKLGKFKNIQEEEAAASASTSSNVVDSRRCYSMGSSAYIMDHNSSFRVPIPNTANNASTLYLPRSAISEYASDSTRDFQLQGSLARTRRPDSEIEFNVADDEDKNSCYSLESSTTNATTTKRTLNWLMGRHHNKIVNSSSFSSSTIV